MTELPVYFTFHWIWSRILIRAVNAVSAFSFWCCCATWSFLQLSNSPPKKNSQLVSCCSYFGREPRCIADAPILDLWECRWACIGQVSAEYEWTGGFWLNRRELNTFSPALPSAPWGPWQTQGQRGDRKKEGEGEREKNPEVSASIASQEWRHAQLVYLLFPRPSMTDGCWHYWKSLRRDSHKAPNSFSSSTSPIRPNPFNKSRSV